MPSPGLQEGQYRRRFFMFTDISSIVRLAPLKRGKAQVLGLDELERPQRTLGLFISSPATSAPDYPPSPLPLAGLLGLAPNMPAHKTSE